MSVSDDVGDDWRAVHRRSAATPSSTTLIAAEALKADETRAFVADAFRDGASRRRAPRSRRSSRRPRASRRTTTTRAKKQRVLGKLVDFFERYTGLI